MAAGGYVFTLPLAARILAPIGVLLSPAVGDNAEYSGATTNVAQ